MENETIVNADEKSEEQDEHAQVQGTEKPSEKGDSWIPKTRLDQEIRKRRDAEAMIESICNDYVEAVPEEYRDCIPELAPADKIAWVKRALDHGLFNENSKIESGPDSKRPIAKPTIDLSNMSPMSLLEQGYRKNKK